MIQIQSNALDTVRSINTFNSYHVVIGVRKGLVSCLMESHKDLADVAHTKMLDAKCEKVLTQEINNYYCEYRKKFLCHEFVAYSMRRQEAIPLSDATSLNLFIADLAMETPGFSENLRLDPESRDNFKLYWDLADELIEDDKGMMSMQSHDDDIHIFKCVDQSEGYPKVHNTRLTCQL